MCVCCIYIHTCICTYNTQTGWHGRAQADLKQKMSNFVIYYPNPVSVSDSFGCLASAGGVGCCPSPLSHTACEFVAHCTLPECVCARVCVYSLVCFVCFWLVAALSCESTSAASLHNYNNNNNKHSSSI